MTQTIGIVGYGNQGKSWAANLRDEGWIVSILLRSSSSLQSQAERDGFMCRSMESLGECQTVALLIPDDAMPSFVQTYGRHFRPQQSLIFAHGYALHFHTAPWPKDQDLILVAPKGIGPAVREKYLSGTGVPAVLAVFQNVTGNAWTHAERIAKGLGATRAGVYRATVQEEVESDLFSEQALLCGGLPALIAEAFSTLTSKGIQPEVAYLECVHELAFITDLIQKHGIHGMLRHTSPTARFGGLKGAQQFRTEELRHVLENIFANIRNGSFTHELAQETQNSFPTTDRDMGSWQKSEIETVGRRMREKLFAT